MVSSSAGTLVTSHRSKYCVISPISKIYLQTFKKKNNNNIKKLKKKKKKEMKKEEIKILIELLKVFL